MSLLSFIPTPYKIIAVLGALGAFLTISAWVVNRIDAKGYKRCKDEYAVASATAKDTARSKIIPTGKKYDKIKNDVARQPNLYDPVGRLVALAIDKLPIGGGSGDK